MSLGTLEREAPSLFKREASAISRCAAYSALALFLMVADVRFQITEPVRHAISTVLYPVQWAVVQPIRLMTGGAGYLQDLEHAQKEVSEAQRQMAAMVLQARDAQLLAQENAHLRGLLDLRPRLQVPTLTAQVVYEAPDSYTRRVVLDKGQIAGVVPGSPVVDELGVLGQVTRVQPFTSEVTLLVDRNQAIPVLLARTGIRSVAYGDASNLRSDGMELRFMPSDADVQIGDVLTTSGIDGVYPSGLPVAKVVQVEPRAESAFTRIYCQPLARMQGARHVMVLTPLDELKAAEHPELDAALQAADAEKAREDKSAQRRATTSIALPESTAPQTPTSSGQETSP